VLSHRIALVPTAAQEVLLRQAVGVSRFAYNWALAEWKGQYPAGEKPSEAALRRQLNSIKRQQFPWMRLGSQVRAPASHQELRGGVSAILQKAGLLS
jgi:transposase